MDLKQEQKLETLKLLLRKVVEWNNEYNDGDYFDVTILNDIIMSSNEYREPKKRDNPINVFYGIDYLMNGSYKESE